MMAEQQLQRRTWRPTVETIAWVAIAALVVWIQWPMLKGLYYRATAAAPPAATIAWRTDFDMALAEARATGKNVLVDFSADWCPPCVVMKHDVWPNARVASLIAENYVPVLVDMDGDADVPSRYRVEAIPTILIVDGQGAVLARAGYLPVSAMERLLTERVHGRPEGGAD